MGKLSFSLAGYCDADHVETQDEPLNLHEHSNNLATEKRQKLTPPREADLKAAKIPILTKTHGKRLASYLNPAVPY
jgi:hypothetical protein